MARALIICLSLWQCLSSSYAADEPALLRDPTRSQGSPVQLDSTPATQENAQVKLEMVVSGKEGATKGVALQNGQLVRVGDTLDGNKIIAIEAFAVTVRKQDGSVEKVALYPAVQVQPVTPETNSLNPPHRRSKK